MISSLGVERADGTFISHMVNVTNFQSTEITMNTSLFELVDGSGKARLLPRQSDILNLATGSLLPLWRQLWKLRLR
jgi:hypothetical protein